MTTTCREACCNVIPRLTVAELFERGFRRNRAAPLSIEGAACGGADGNTARFSLEVSNGKIAAVGFHVSCCATLIAYCEFIAETVAGFRPETARDFTAANLVESVPGVPALKRDRAVLAIAAFRAALVAAETQLSVIPGRAAGANPESISTIMSMDREVGIMDSGQPLTRLPE